MYSQVRYNPERQLLLTSCGPVISCKTRVSDFILLTFIQTFQSFGGRPSVFVAAKYTRDTKSNDAMYVWLENVNSGSFEVCIREFLPFDAKHQDIFVVSNTLFAIYNQPYMVCKAFEGFTLRQRRLFQNIRYLRPPSLSLMLLLLYYFYCFFKSEEAPKMVQNMRKKGRRREIWKKIIIKSKLALKHNLGLN